MNDSTHNSSSAALAENSISGVGVIFLLGFMLLCALGVLRGWNAQSSEQLFGHVYTISAEQVRHKMG